jgi:cobalt-zinc-cadmium resistance protein CzcA
VLARLLQWSLQHRLAVFCAWGVAAFLGAVSLWRLPMDAFPDTTPVQVQVNTVAPALAPLEIERTITTPIESAISGLPGLTNVRSLSKFGFSQITVTFEDDTAVYLARNVVAERVAGVELPAGIERPKLGPPTTGLGEVFHYVLTGEDHSLAELRSAHDWIVRPYLRATPGVAEVNAWGGDEAQVHVRVDPLELDRHGLSLDRLAQAIERNNLNVGGGTLDVAGESTLVHGIGLATGVADVESMVIDARDGVPIRVRDVARVGDGREIRRGAVTADGRGEVVLGLAFMLAGENSHDVTRRLRLRLDEIRASLPAGMRVEPVYERTALVERVLGTVRTNLLEGALLVVAVLFVFLGRLRAGLIVASAIPLSLLFAGNLMLRFGIAGSLMSLGAIDFGLIVDSAVIQVENAVRRLSEAPPGRNRLDVVRDAVLEVRRPTLYGELIIAIVYLPVLALEGVEGKLFRPMALTVLFALLGSLVMSLTLVPALASLGLPAQRDRGDNRVVRALKRAYRPVLAAALRRPVWVLALAVVALAHAGLLATRLGSEFVPRLSEGTVVINTVRLAGVSLDESVRYGVRIERALLEKFPDEVERIWTRTGSAEIATDPMGIELSDVFVVLRPRAGWKRARTQADLVERMAADLSSMPGMRMVFTQPIEMRMNEMIAGARSDLAVGLFGTDFAALRERAREVEAALRAIPGAADVVVEQITGQPVLEIVVDRQAIARHGVPAADVLSAVEALGGRHVGAVQDGDRRVPIVLRLDDRARGDAGAIGRILVGGESGDRFPLGRLATIRTVEAPSTIQREWGRRRVVIQANVRGRDLGGFVADARDAIATRVALPPGMFVRFGGQFEHLERARTRLLLVVPMALALVFALLYFTYGRALDAARVFLGVPFAAVGGILALWLRDLPFSVSAGVGFVALCGVAVLGDMVLVSTFRQLADSGMPPREAVVQAAETRLRPVLMTALVASLGFVPMALNTGIGAEVQRPLATVVIGGVVSSTLLTLLVLPVLLARLGARGRVAGAAGASAPSSISGG